MSHTQVRHGHARSFGFMRRSECDVTASRIATMPVCAWEAPDGTILVWPVGTQPIVQRERPPGCTRPTTRYVYYPLDAK